MKLKILLLSVFSLLCLAGNAENPEPRTFIIKKIYVQRVDTNQLTVYLKPDFAELVYAIDFSQFDYVMLEGGDTRVRILPETSALRLPEIVVYYGGRNTILSWDNSIVFNVSGLMPNGLGRIDIFKMELNKLWQASYPPQ